MTTKQHPMTVTDRVRSATNAFVTWAGTTLHRAGVHPDVITIVGTLIVLAASVLIGQGRFQLGAVVLMIAFPMDALDGAVARAMGRTTQFGAVLDSTLDRFSDGFIFAGLSYYFAVQDQFEYMLLALAVILGSYGVSYVRARAGEADLSVKIGAFSRLERIIALLIGLWIPPLMVVVLVVLAIGTNFTTVQRLWYVYKHIDE